MARDWCKFSHDYKPVAAMVLVQIVFAGVNVFYKLATDRGMSLRVLVAYRFIFATAFLFPLAFFKERKTRPKLTWMVAFQAFLCGLFGGSLTQNLYIAGMKETSATFVSAMANLIPAVTFILAVTLRLERLAIRTLSGQAKVIGTLIGVSGAMLLTFYKGVELNIWPWEVNLLKQDPTGGHQESGNHVMGSLLAVGSCFSFAIWLIIQTKMSEKYPCHYSSTALMCFMASIQSVTYSLIVDQTWSAWKLGWDIKLAAAVYSGVLASGMIVTVMSWCIRRKGPLFVSVFSPLMLICVALMGSMILNEKLHLGCVLGSALIIIGLYAVLWGKGKEMAEIVKLPLKSETTDETTVSNLGSKSDSKGFSNKQDVSIIEISV